VRRHTASPSPGCFRKGPGFGRGRSSCPEDATTAVANGAAGEASQLDLRDMSRQLMSHVDESLGELREDLSRMQQDFAMQVREIGRISELQLSYCRRAETLEQGLAEESEARRESERAQTCDLLGLGRHLTSRIQNMEGSLTEVRDKLQQFDEQLCSADAAPMKAATAVVRAATPDATTTTGSDSEVDTAAVRNGERVGFDDEESATIAGPRDFQLERHNLAGDMDTRITEECTRLHSWISEEWTKLHGWVDAAVVAVVNRVSSLECLLQTEVTNRAACMQDISEAVAQISQHLNQLQAEMPRTASARRFISSPASAGTEFHELETCSNVVVSRLDSVGADSFVSNGKSEASTCPSTTNLSYSQPSSAPSLPAQTQASSPRAGAPMLRPRQAFAAHVPATALSSPRRTSFRQGQGQQLTLQTAPQDGQQVEPTVLWAGLPSTPVASSTGQPGSGMCRLSSVDGPSCPGTPKQIVQSSHDRTRPG